MRLERRIAAYGVCRDDAGRVLLVRLSRTALEPGRWLPPGGGIDHGEHPADAVVREIREETGLLVEVTGLRAVLADVVTAGDLAVHNDRIVYDVVVRGGELRDELDGTTDAAAWHARDDLPTLPLLPFAAEVLRDETVPLVGQSVTGPAAGGGAKLSRLALAALARASRLFPPCSRPSARSLRSLDSEPAAGGGAKLSRLAGAARGQRFAVYGLVTDPAGRVLLTLIAEGYPGAGRWHLPGGGTDHGEQPESAFLRELAEESDQVGRVTGLLDVSHLRNPAALGPEGYPIDFHSVRVLYRAVVDLPTEATVTEAAGGSTARAAWFPPADAARLPLTGIAHHALGWLRPERTMN